MIADGEVVSEHVTRALAVLNYDQLAEVQRRVESITYAPGSVIVRQGDVGEYFYILTGGRADVFVEHPDGHEISVDHLRAGQYFGEMALVGHQARRATVRAADDGPVSVATLDRDAFNKLVEESPALRQDLQRVISLRQLQSEVDALADVDRPTLQRLTADAPTRLFSPGETIIRRGELGETFYFILAGEVEVFAARNGHEALIDRLGPGGHFGELALLGNRRRMATVRAAGSEPARLLELDGTAFEQLRQLSDRFATEVDETAAVRRDRIS
jgi:cAMP-dependent protein kinase regulator